MARQNRSGAIGLKLAMICGGATMFVSAVLTASLVQTMGVAIDDKYQEYVSRGWIVGLSISVVCGLVVGLIAYLRGAALGNRVTELGLGVAKIGRGSGEVRVRFGGQDEIAHLGRALQYLATDLAAVAREAEQGGGLGASMDPLVREMRDRTLPDSIPEIDGYEVDGALAPGGRGGMDYFDCIYGEHGGVLFLVSNEGAGATSAVAARMARDEIVRALNAKANARKALSHTNRVLHKQLPKGVCATVCMLALSDDEVKLYQAGFRSPLLVCAAGRVQEVGAEGLALGLDEGPVFEKGLRSTVVPVSQGTRVVIANDAAQRLEGFHDIVAEHSPKHTAPFMNLVLGGLESQAGEGGLREDVVLLTAKRW